MENTNESKIIKFADSAEAYETLALKKLDAKDFEGALVCFLQAEKKAKNKLSLFVNIADIYFDMELYEYSADYWFKALNVAPKWERWEIYEGLGMCYYHLGNISVAAHYFTLEIECGNEDAYCYEMEQTFNQFMPKAEVGVVYSGGVRDYAEDIERAAFLTRQGKHDEAVEILEAVPQISNYYDQAQLDLSLIYFAKKDLDKAIEINRNIYEKNKHNIAAICNLVMLYRCKGMDMHAETYLSCLDEKLASGDEDLFRIATTYCDNGYHQRAVTCFKKLIINRPYNIPLIFFYGIALYNSGDFRASRDMFGKILRITDRNPVALCYFRLADKMAESGAKSADPLVYTYRTPVSYERRNYVKLISLLRLTNLRVIRKKLREPESLELIDWSFSSSDVAVQKGSAIFLALAETRQTDAYLLERLIDPSVADEVKESVIETLVQREYSRSIGIVVSNIYKKIAFYTFGGENIVDNMFAAYALCYAKAACSVEEYDLRKIYDAANDVYYNNEKSALIKNSEQSALAAVIFMRSGVESAVALSDVAALFDCEEAALKKLAEKLV